MDDDKQKTHEELLDMLFGSMGDEGPLGMHVVTDMEEWKARRRKRQEERKQRMEERKRLAQEKEREKPLTTNPPPEFSDIDG